MKNIVILFVFILLFSSCKEEVATSQKSKVAVYEPEIRFGYNLDNYKVIQDTIRSGESFGIILDRHHVFYPKINKIAATVKETFDVRKVRAGKPYTILASKDSTEKAQVFIYKHNKINATILDFKDSIITAKEYKKPIKTLEKEAIGVVNSNFTFSMDSLGLRPNLTYKVADIYAWTLDFLTLQKGDSFKLVYEEKFIDDSIFAGYGRVKSAVFKHKGKNLYAFRFLADSTLNIHEYYDDKAKMLRSQFLKAPIKFQYRISSRYNLRRRIAYYGNRVKPHKGTDFAAKVGTPIIATASGTVTESTRRGGNGKYVKIKHNNTYSTQYLHMSKQAVKKGQYVRQGDVIGYVGMTGNTGGPHVCYRFWKHGRQVDPLKEKLPAAKPMKNSVKPSFFKYIKPLKYQLDNLGVYPGQSQNNTEIIAQN
ncbi:MAG: peptidoglycan DD-metalloendopeptidase family protein [Polaribacter sp.]